MSVYENKGSLDAKVVVTVDPDRSGNIVCTGTSMEDDINAAFDYLTSGRTWKEKVLLKGDFDIDGTIQIPNYTVLDIRGNIFLVNGSNVTMIENADRTNGGAIEILNGWLDGNNANNAAGHGIDITNSGSTTPYNPVIIVRNMIIVDVQDDGLRINPDGSDRALIDYVTVHNTNAGYGCLFWCGDSVIERLYVTEAYMNAFFLRGGDHRVAHCYFGGGGGGGVTEQVRLDYIKRTDWIGNIVDSSRNDGIRLTSISNKEAYGNRFIGGQVTNSSQAAHNTDDDIYVEGDCYDNLFMGMLLGRKDYAGATYARYGINEVSNWGLDPYDNRYVDLEFNAHGTAHVSLQQNAKTHSSPYRFTEAAGGASIDTAEPVGIHVEANGESAVTWGSIFKTAQQVWKLRVVGVANDGPVAAGGQMHGEFTFNAGAMNAAYNTAAKSWNIANFDSEEADYVANDGISWIILDTDVGNELRALAGDDTFSFHAIHEASADPDGDTDCKFRVLEVYYV